MKIIYINDQGAVAVVHPTAEALQTRSMVAIAIKDVPFGKPFKIIADGDLPAREDRGAWEVDPASLNDGVGGESSEFPPADHEV